MNGLEKGKSVPLTGEQMEMMLQATMMDLSEGEKPVTKEDLLKSFSESEIPFPMGVVLKRIEGMKLPISFSLGGLLMTAVLPDRVGGVVIMLIDLLSEYEGQVVTVRKIAERYPFGFYSEEALIERIDALTANPSGETFGYVY